MHDRANHMGGPSVNLRRLLPELTKRGHSIHLICFHSGAHPNGDILKKMGVHCHFKKINVVSKITVPWVIDRCIEIEPDIVIGDVSTQVLLAGRWLRKSGIPVVNTMRGNDDLNWGKATFFSVPGKWQSSGIVFVSEYLQNTFIERVETAIIQKVIPSGVLPSNHFTEQQKEQLGIVYSGRLTNRIKNVHLIVDIFVAMAKKYPTLTFALIGEGEEKQNIENLIQTNGLSKQILLKSPLSGQDYKAFLAAYQMIILASDSEGMPGAIMDGMSCGLIPVVAPFKGIDGLVLHGENGFIAEDSYGSIMDYLESCISDGNLRLRMSKRAIESIDEYFSVASAADSWERLFEELTTSIDKTKIKKPLFFNFPTNPLLIEHETISWKEPIKRKMKALLQRLKRTFLK